MYRSRRYKRSTRPTTRGRGAYYYRPSAAFLNNFRGKGEYRARGPRVAYGLENRKSKSSVSDSAIVGALRGAMLGMQMSGMGKYRGYRRSIRGRGDYTVGAPISSGSDLVLKGNVPSMHAVGDGIRISHKECIGTLYSTTGFAVNTYEVNPGINSCFPWLSGIARNFQEYDIRGLMFIYKPTCSDAIAAATISAMGSVSMSSDMNVMAHTPTSTVEMLQSKFSASAKPSQEIVMAVEQDKRMGGGMTNHLLVRSGDVPTGSVKQFYDDCVVHIATDANGAAGVVLGQLFCTYDICFYAAATVEPGNGTLMCKGAFTNFTSAVPFGAAATDFQHPRDTIGVTRTSGTVLTLDKGNVGYFLITLCYRCNAGLQVVGSLTFGGGATAVTGRWFGPANQFAAGGGAASDGTALNYFFRIQDPTLTSTITVAGFTLTTPLGSDIMITQLNPVFAD